MQNTVLELVAQYLVPFIVGVVAIFIVPPIKEWLISKNLYDYVVIGVQAAEQIFGSKKGQEKFEYVRSWVMSKFKLSEEDLKMLIEAAVLEMNKTLM